MFLLKLIVVELFIVKFGGRWGCRLATSENFRFLDKVLGSRWWRSLLFRSIHLGIDSGFLLGRGMQLLLEQRLDDAGTGGGFGVRASVDLSALDSQAFVHDGASSSIVLELRDGTATRALVSGGAEGSQDSRGGFLEKWANALGLSK